MNAEMIAALNALLEEERATVDTLVALVSMATDTFERQALTTMGGQAVQACIDLRDDLERQEAPVGHRVSPSIGHILSPDHLDDRLRAFSALQQALANRCEQLQEANLDPDTRGLLARLREVQLAHALWSERRADEFAASRPEPDPALVPFMPNHQGTRGERPWALPTPERRTRLTPRLAADYAGQRTPAGDHAELAGSADPALVAAPDDASFPTSPMPEERSAPPAEGVTASALDDAPEATYDASGAVDALDMMDMMDTMDTVDTPIAATGTADPASDSGSPPQAPPATSARAPEAARLAGPAERAPRGRPNALPAAAAIANDELPELATALDVPEDTSATDERATDERATDERATDPKSEPPAPAIAPNGGKPRAPAKPRATRPRTTSAKAKPRPPA